MPTKLDDEQARAFLDIPPGFAAPELEAIVQDSRATLLHNLTLYTEAKENGVIVSPIWENQEGKAALRQADLPPEIAARYFEGKGLASLKDATVLEMVGDVILMLLEQPSEAASVLEATHDLWVRSDAPVRSLQIPYKGHFKIMTIVLADLARKVSAGFGELEWLASLGLLEAFHDPAHDPPADQILGLAKELTAKMHADEAAWMKAHASKPAG
jgi:hypothetical protein